MVGNSILRGNVGVGGSTNNNYKLNVTGASYTSTNAKIGGSNTLQNSSAQLELGDSNKGFLPNRVFLTSLTNKGPISNVQEGMIVYNINTNPATGVMPGFYYWTINNNWQRLVDEVPTTGIKMYYQTSNIKGGIAHGEDQSNMVSIPFSASRNSNSPVTLTLPERGSYAFGIKLHTSVGDSNAPNMELNASFKYIAYLGIWVNGELQDISEVFGVVEVFENTAYYDGNFVTNVVLGCYGNAGDVVDVRIGYLSSSVGAYKSVWSIGKTSSRPISDATSMTFWKL